MTETAATETLVITRVFDAPRELVYRAFTDPDQLAQWFGPVGFSVPRETVSVDARAGGYQRFTMVNDTDPSFTSPVDATFTEVVENELLVGYEEVQGVPGFPDGARLEVRIEFHDEGGDRTRLVLRQGPYTREVEADAREGWDSSFGKLDALLAR
ncbi:SRPBCC domain-containing protein [Micromonospora sp. NBC_01655]|uniref:SRPBCC family protein n=1 Tax=Micromonospora sp. NBC_01655 TaxID=2975983 RepID=UPI00225A18C7|nr:SRPBCC domain-containing protein [Micromonospora sp. NBC_01655]MCX4470872.1 SRPBCC domain-containing protein [Micromonospora sp. NBC_01655]